jgi:hypothetical protein
MNFMAHHDLSYIRWKYFMAQPKGFVMWIKEEKECCLTKSFMNDNIQR